jgi:hypothetical protein
MKDSYRAGMPRFSRQRPTMIKLFNTEYEPNPCNRRGSSTGYTHTNIKIEGAVHNTCYLFKGDEKLQIVPKVDIYFFHDYINFLYTTI